MCIRDRVMNCMHPEDAPEVDRIVGKALAEGKEYEVQYRMRRKDGSYIWVNDIGRRGIAEDGRDVCISTIRDITKEIRAETELAMKEEQFRIAAMQSGNIIFQYDLESQTVFASKEIAERFGVQEKQTGVPYETVKMGMEMCIRDSGIRWGTRVQSAAELRRSHPKFRLLIPLKYLPL